MSRFTHRLWQRALGCGICIALVSGAPAVVAQDAPLSPVAPKVSPQQLQTWLAELDSESFDVREAAAEKLAQAGPAAVDVLASGIVSESAETAWRSGASLERIAMTSDEKTLAQITGVLDKLSAKGKPGLRTMAAEMHVRQKHFRHDRAVASLQKNGAVFAGDGMELGGGGIFVGGPIAMGGPVFIEEAIEVVPIVEPVPAPPEADAGIFGLIGRIFGGKAKLGDELPPDIEIREAIPEEAPRVDPPVEEPPAAEKPADVKAGEPAQLLEEFKELAEPAKDPVAADIQVLAPPPALVEAVEIVDGADIRIVDFGFGGGGGIIGFDEGEVQTSASLMLGKQWRGGDDGLKVLKDVPEIWNITLNGAKITDAALRHMEDLPSLNNLQVRDTAVTRQGLRNLRERRPNLQVQARGEAMMGVNADIGTSPLVLTSIFPDSGAYRAGLREGDVIKSVDGTAIKDFADLTISIYGLKAGEKVRVAYERNGAKNTAEVTLKKRGDDQ